MKNKSFRILFVYNGIFVFCLQPAGTAQRSVCQNDQ